MPNNNAQELEIPPVAKSDPNAIEILRLWAVPEKEQQVVLRTTWLDAGAWGLMLADIARHVANAYANEGRDRADVLSRIRQVLDVEFAHPTDTPSQL